MAYSKTTKVDHSTLKGTKVQQEHKTNVKVYQKGKDSNMLKGAVLMSGVNCFTASGERDQRYLIATDFDLRFWHV